MTLIFPKLFSTVQEYNLWNKYNIEIATASTALLNSMENFPKV